MVKVSEIHWNPLNSLFLQLNIPFFHGENPAFHLQEVGARLEQGESAKEKLRSEKESLEAPWWFSAFSWWFSDGFRDTLNGGNLTDVKFMKHWDLETNKGFEAWNMGNWPEFTMKHVVFTYQ